MTGGPRLAHVTVHCPAEEKAVGLAAGRARGAAREHHERLLLGLVVVQTCQVSGAGTSLFQSILFLFLFSSHRPSNCYLIHERGALVLGINLQLAFRGQSNRNSEEAFPTCNQVLPLFLFFMFLLPSLLIKWWIKSQIFFSDGNNHHVPD